MLQESRIAVLLLMPCSIELPHHLLEQIPTHPNKKVRQLLNSSNVIASEIFHSHVSRTILHFDRSPFLTPVQRNLPFLRISGRYVVATSSFRRICFPVVALCCACCWQKSPQKPFLATAYCSTFCDCSLFPSNPFLLQDLTDRPPPHPNIRVQVRTVSK